MTQSPLTPKASSRLPIAAPLRGCDLQRFEVGIGPEFGFRFHASSAPTAGPAAAALCSPFAWPRPQAGVLARLLSRRQWGSQESSLGSSASTRSFAAKLLARDPTRVASAQGRPGVADLRDALCRQGRAEARDLQCSQDCRWKRSRGRATCRSRVGFRRGACIVLVRVSGAVSCRSPLSRSPRE